MRIQMTHDERKKLIFKISATVPRFEMEEISIKGSDDPDIKEIKYTEIPGGFGDVGIRVFESDHPIHDIVRIIQARSERGSRRLPRERSSEISKNCH